MKNVAVENNFLMHFVKVISNTTVVVSLSNLVFFFFLAGNALVVIIISIGIVQWFAVNRDNILKERLTF